MNILAIFLLILVSTYCVYIFNFQKKKNLYFNQKILVLDQNTVLMPVKLPEKLAEELYYYLIANTPSYVCNQDGILQGKY